MRRVTLGNSPDRRELLPKKKTGEEREAGRGEGGLLAPSPRSRGVPRMKDPKPKADKFGVSLADRPLNWGHWQRCSRRHEDGGGRVVTRREHGPSLLPS